MSTAMPETPAAPASAPAADTPPAAPVPSPPPSGSVTPGNTPPPASSSETLDVTQLPPAAQQLIAELRAENGKVRRQANGTTAKEQGAAEATERIVRELAKAAGIALPGDKPDPEKLTADLTAERTTSQQARLELAIYKSAGTAGANPDALLDSRSFLDAVKAIDPKSATFATEVDAAIKAAVAANPNFKNRPGAGASGVEITGGSGEPGQISEDQLKTMTPEQIVDARKKGLLKNLLGG